MENEEGFLLPNRFVTLAVLVVEFDASDSHDDSIEPFTETLSSVSNPVKVERKLLFPAGCSKKDESIESSMEALLSNVMTLFKCSMEVIKTKTSVSRKTRSTTNIFVVGLLFLLVGVEGGRIATDSAFFT